MRCKYAEQTIKMSSSNSERYNNNKKQNKKTLFVKSKKLREVIKDRSILNRLIWTFVFETDTETDCNEKVNDNRKKETR